MELFLSQPLSQPLGWVFHLSFKVNPESGGKVQPKKRCQKNRAARCTLTGAGGQKWNPGQNGAWLTKQPGLQDSLAYKKEIVWDIRRIPPGITSSPGGSHNIFGSFTQRTRPASAVRSC